MPDYKNGKIYKLWSPEGDDIYIGSTVNSLAKRKGDHKADSNSDIIITSKILFEKYDDVRIELIEEFPCKNKMELNKREGYYIRTLDCVNRYVAGRTQKEYNEDNREKIKEQQKQYKEGNKEHIKIIKKKYTEEHKEDKKDYDKDYYEKNKEQKKEYYEKNKEYFKERKGELYENNKDEINQRRREYYEKNKDEINKRRRELWAMKKSLLLSPA